MKNWHELEPDKELPPRARRIRFSGCGTLRPQGTTSACAENTVDVPAEGWLVRNYLRVRGEYAPAAWYFSRIWELPPRARRIPDVRQSTRLSGRNYLRVRGEYGYHPRTC